MGRARGRTDYAALVRHPGTEHARSRWPGRDCPRTDGGWRRSATRDAYADFAREHYGLQARQPDGHWELGLLAQRNELAGTPDAKRVGSYVQWHGLIKGVDSSTQLAAANIDPDSLGVRFGGEQRLAWRGDRLSVDGTFQVADEGFDLEGRSSRQSNATVIWQQDPLQWFVRGMDSRDDGSLRTEEQRRSECGLPGAAGGYSWS